MDLSELNMFRNIASLLGIKTLSREITESTVIPEELIISTPFYGSYIFRTCAIQTFEHQRESLT